jgi:hypothetical membrane protein
MISQRGIGLIAVATPLWFLVIYLVMSEMRPEYSHLTKAISELGSLDAPHKWAWNILGYMLPGAAVALLGVGLLREPFLAGNAARIPLWALVASGLLMTLSGIFPGDFENRTSTTMILHAVGSFGSFVAFLVAGFWLPFLVRKHSQWGWIAWPSLALVVGSIVTGFLRTGATPGLGQRLGFTCFFLWVGLVGIAMLRGQRRVAAV